MIKKFCFIALLLSSLTSTAMEQVGSSSLLKRLLFVGNPGSGKSTLLNSLIGRVCFKSGMGVGTGLTELLQRYVETGGDIEYLDTPGLNDLEKKKQAAAEITKALQLNGEYRLFFVITLENGRIRPDDKATMKIVLDALKEHHPNMKFGIIINQLSINEFSLVERNISKYTQMLNNGLPMTTDSIYLYQEIQAAKCVEDFQMPLNTEFENFILSLPPVIITPEEVTPVCLDRYDEIIDELGKKNKELEIEIKLMSETHQKEIQQAAEERAKLLAEKQHMASQLQQFQLQERKREEEAKAKEAAQQEAERVKQLEIQRKQDIFSSQASVINNLNCWFEDDDKHTWGDWYLDRENYGHGGTWSHICKICTKRRSYKTEDGMKPCSSQDIKHKWGTPEVVNLKEEEDRTGRVYYTCYCQICSLRHFHTTSELTDTSGRKYFSAWNQ